MLHTSTLGYLALQCLFSRDEHLKLLTASDRIDLEDRRSLVFLSGPNELTCLFPYSCFFESTPLGFLSRETLHLTSRDFVLAYCTLFSERYYRAKMFTERFSDFKPFQQDTRYTILPEKSPVDDNDSSPPERSVTARRKILILLALVLVVAVTLVTVIVALAGPKTVDQCGHTPEEARKRGCSYDIVSFSWLPEDCLDHEIEQDFIALHDWKFYRDFNMTQEVSLEEAMLGEAIGYFVPWEFHTTHCGYLFKKLHRAMKRGGKVDSYIGNVTHTDHCVKWMLDPPPEAFEAKQFTYRKYPFCGRDGGIGVEDPHKAKELQGRR